MPLEIEVKFPVADLPRLLAPPPSNAGFHEANAAHLRAQCPLRHARSPPPLADDPSSASGITATAGSSPTNASRQNNDPAARHKHREETETTGAGRRVPRPHLQPARIPPPLSSTKNGAPSSPTPPATAFSTKPPSASMPSSKVPRTGSMQTGRKLGVDPAPVPHPQLWPPLRSLAPVDRQHG